MGQTKYKLSVKNWPRVMNNCWSPGKLMAKTKKVTLEINMSTMYHVNFIEVSTDIWAGVEDGNPWSILLIVSSSLCTERRSRNLFPQIQICTFLWRFRGREFPEVLQIPSVKQRPGTARDPWASAPNQILPVTETKHLCFAKINSTMFL